jgi:predicted small lipoprotein YifL
MRAFAILFLLVVLLQACGSKGPLFLPSETSGDQQTSSNKQK